VRGRWALTLGSTVLVVVLGLVVNLASERLPERFGSPWTLVPVLVAVVAVTALLDARRDRPEPVATPAAGTGRRPDRLDSLRPPAAAWPTWCGRSSRRCPAGCWWWTTWTTPPR
jgi:hypothetical protein